MWVHLALMLTMTDSTALKDFKQRVDQYVQVQQKIEKALNPVEETANAAVLVTQKQQFAKEMQAARPLAAQGDIFVRGVRPILLKIIKQQLGGKGNATPRSMVMGEGNPSAGLTLKVNTAYPVEAPKSTVPPSLLLALPQLPEELEYRFMGRNLILRDTKTDLIVDFILNAVPAS